MTVAQAILAIMSAARLDGGAVGLSASARLLARDTGG
jgi:hypothetical protein